MTISEVPLRPELWTNIFEFAQRLYMEASNGGDGISSPFYETMKNLCLTCRVFREFAIPFLLEELNLDGENSLNLLKKVRWLEKLFVDVPGSSKRIRYVRIALRNRGPSTTEQADAVKIISEALLPQMTALRLINIEHTVISPSIYAHFYKFAALKSVRLWSISFEEDPVTPDLRLEDLSLRNVTFYDLHTSEEFVKNAAARLAFSPLIETLHLSSSIAQAAFNLGPSLGVESLDQLKVLSLIEPTGAVLADFFTFARLCPNLTCIRTFLSQDFDLQFTLGTPTPPPSDILLNLKTLQCSYSLAETLVPGRNITDLRCDAPFDAGQTLPSVYQILRHTHGLQSLTLRWIDWSEGLFEIVSVNAPELQTLDLWITEDSCLVSTSLFPRASFLLMHYSQTWLSHNLVEAIQPFKRLARLQCFANGDPGNVLDVFSNDDQIPALARLMDSNPVLEHVAINFTISWDKDSNGAWSLSETDPV